MKMQERGIGDMKMNYVQINEKTYGYAVNFKDNDVLRSSFNALTRKTYGFDFEEWYQNGYWQERYIPYSLFDGVKTVSNASVNVIDFIYLGDKRRFIQIGTVMTDIEYRNQGLNRFLMEKVLEDWKGNCDLIYLFANDSVLDFYPKFGFEPAAEYQHSKDLSVVNPTSKAIKLDMSDNNNRVLLYNAISESVPFSQLAMKDNTSLVMFYCTSIMKESIYYIEDLETIVIADFAENTLYLNDVFCKYEVPLDAIISALANNEITKVIVGFTPIDTTLYEVFLLKEEDTTLFILDDKFKIFTNRKVMFPVLSHA